ncbi:transcription antitermination factor NusB [Alicyclobacillus acidiphilus]|uniref:transcription antitermination factor NusB n=1 Tax=Alicyclobacillus acidiphilus TaxID=182455 RepID=UPI0009F9D754|nr:transcription antitermination factor NusB [Alicyclobacillus acidiphilus]
MTRHEARECAVQALYQIDASDSTVMDAISFVLEEKSFSDKDLEYISRLTQGVLEHMDDTDKLLSSVMDRWSPERIGRVERSILRLAVYELMYEKDIAAATVVDEAVRLAKGFASEASGKFVNGVLAKVLAAMPFPAQDPETTDGAEQR